MYTEFTVGDHTYKLRLTMQGIVNLEKELGFTPLQVFMNIDDNVLPKVSDLAVILRQMLQPYNHGINLNDTYDIVEKYVEDGHTLWDLIPVLLEVFKDAGFLPKEEVDDSKN